MSNSIYPDFTDEKLLDEIFEANPKWKGTRKYVDYIALVNPTGFLRFVEKDGRKILQTQYILQIYFTERVSFGSFDGYKSVRTEHWFDVPFVSVD